MSQSCVGEDKEEYGNTAKAVCVGCATDREVEWASYM